MLSIDIKRHARLGFLLLSVAHSAAANELSEPYEAVRPLGMGGAFTAIANDQNSVWTNPAGIGRIRKAHSRNGLHMLSVPNMTLGANSEGRVFSDYLTAGGGGLDPDEAKGAFAALDGVQNKPMWAYAAANPIALFDAPRGSPWAFGAFTTTKMQVIADDDETALVNSVSDMGLVLGVGWATRNNRLNVGLSLRPMTRYDFNDKVEVATLLDRTKMGDKIKEQSNKGTGLGADVGFMWTFADFWFPTLGFAVRNLPTGCVDEYLNPFAEVRQTVCGTTFSGTVRNPESPALVDPMDMRIGLAITPRLSQKFAMRFAFDIHHLYINAGEVYYGLAGLDVLRMVHAGIELFYGNPLMVNPFSARLGFNQGFVTMGATVRVKFLTLEFTSFGQNISSTATPREDRRSLFSGSIEF